MPATTHRCRPGRLPLSSVCRAWCPVHAAPPSAGQNIPHATLRIAHVCRKGRSAYAAMPKNSTTSAEHPWPQPRTGTILRQRSRKAHFARPSETHSSDRRRMSTVARVNPSERRCTPEFTQSGGKGSNEEVPRDNLNAFGKTGAVDRVLCVNSHWRKKTSVGGPRSDCRADCYPTLHLHLQPNRPPDR